MAFEESAGQLREQGAVLLRGMFPADSLVGLRRAAVRCFEAIGKQSTVPERYQFNRSSHSLLLASLADFGCSSEELAAPLSAPGLDQMFSRGLEGAWTCRMEQAWVRKKFAPLHVSDPRYQPHTWHQDGALGVRFPPEIGPVIPMTQLLTCWIPLGPCGKDSPGLEFIRRRQSGLLHFTELDDAVLRRRFPARDFWAPVLELGDGVVFLNSTLHRTYATPEMAHDRLSVEYRLYPR